MTAANAAPDVRFRGARPGDDAELTRLFHRSFGRRMRSETWRWKLGGPGPPTRVLVGEDGGRLVFQMGGLPRGGVVRGRPVSVMIAVDAMTSPERRREGILTEGCRRLFELWRGEGVSLVLGLPNERWGSRSRALGWRPWFDLAWRVRLLRPEAVLARRAGWPPLARLTAAGSAWNAWWDGRTPRAAGIDVAQAPPAADEVDALSAELLGASPAGLVRDAAWLRWRYLEEPSGAYRVVYARRSGRLAGWVAYRHQRETERSVGYLAEVAAVDDEAHAALTAAAVKRLREEGAESVATLARPTSARDGWLRRMGFRHSWGAFTVHAVVLDPGLDGPQLSDPGIWRLEGGDFDVL